MKESLAGHIGRSERVGRSSAASALLDCTWVQSRPASAQVAAYRQ
jgi:hypothetical protein